MKKPLKIEVIESISNAKKYYAVTFDGRCNHGGELIEEDVEDDNSHRVARLGFCDRCGAQYNDADNEWIENLHSRSHAQTWIDWIMNGGEMPKFLLGQPVVHEVIFSEGQ